MQRRIEALLDEADAAVTASNWTEVAEKARAALVIDADNADAVTFLKMAEANGVAPSGGPQSEPSSPCLLSRANANKISFTGTSFTTTL